MFKIGIQENFSTNWKVPTDLLKKTHNRSDKTNVKQEQFKATDRNIDLFDDGIKDIKKAKEINNKKIEGIIVGKAIYDGDIKLDELAKEISA